jgi:hypothetical protein
MADRVPDANHRLEVDGFIELAAGADRLIDCLTLSLARGALLFYNAAQLLRCSASFGSRHLSQPALSWLFFKARAKCRYLDHNGGASPAPPETEKQPTGRSPEGCVSRSRIEPYRFLIASYFISKRLTPGFSSRHLGSLGFLP